MIKATKNGIAGIFSDNDWKSGQPQRYGWQEEGKEGKTLPKEIIEFVSRRREKEPPKVEPIKPLEVGSDFVNNTLGTDFYNKVDEPIIKVDKKTKTKKNDTPKQTRRTPRK